jgi:hypothetical protein
MREMYPETHPLSLLPAMAPLLLALAIYPPAVGCEDDDGGRFSVSFFVFVSLGCFFGFFYILAHLPCTSWHLQIPSPCLLSIKNNNPNNNLQWDRSRRGDR